MTTCKRCGTTWITGQKGCPYCHIKGRENLTIHAPKALEPGTGAGDMTLWSTDMNDGPRVSLGGSTWKRRAT